MLYWYKSGKVYYVIQYNQNIFKMHWYPYAKDLAVCNTAYIFQIPDLHHFQYQIRGMIRMGAHNGINLDTIALCYGTCVWAEW